ELIAANPCQPVAVATQAALCARYESTQHIVACLVPEAVVDLLEAVDVAAQDCERMAVALRARQLAAQLLLEKTQVVGAGQWIGDREAAVLAVAGAQRSLDMRDAARDFKPRQYLLDGRALYHIVVGTRGEAGEYVFLALTHGKQNDVGV